MILRYGLLIGLILASTTPARGQQSDEWAQRIRYDIDVTLHPDRHRMDGRELVRYENNSPDTLREVFFHLYFNAFDPESMMAERNRVLPDPDSRIVPRIFNLGPDEVGFHDIESIRQDGDPVEYRITDTVMEVELAEPIPPGGAAEFELEFHSQIPLQTRRSGRDNLEGIDYSMSQWYPKMAAYDERGWHADPYVGREFYAPFGNFDVRITLPSEYTIGATGVLQNAEEIGHGYTADSIAITTDSLTWHFRAENVHDFAWAADPDYVHDVVESENGTPVHLLYEPNVAENWQRLHEWAPQILDFFSDSYGQYPWPQMTVAQAGDGGMEYPMITFITGRRSPPSLRGVTAHEMAHMWYYGVIGTNEADYAWLDEGFASYATTEVIAHLLGNPDPSHVGAYLNVLQAHHFGFFEPLNTPSDWFRTNSAYGVSAYSGGQMVVDMLGYVISDSLRNAFLDLYFERFEFGHPDPFDVEKVAEDVSGVRLDWYFEQFTDTQWTLDYAIDDVSSSPSTGGWTTEITLERASEIVMPVDLRLTLADGSEQWINIPLGIMQGHKPVSNDWIVAEPWQWTFPEYTLTIELPSRVVRAEIDPRLQTPDTDRLNNTARFPLAVSFLESPGQSWTQYNVGWRPLAQYAHHWGLGAGLQARGTYLFNRLQTQATVKLWPEVLFSGGENPELDEFFGGVRPEDLGLDDFSALDGIDYSLSFSNPQRLLGRYGVLTLRSRKHLGITENTISLWTLLGKYDLLSDVRHRLSIAIEHHAQTSDRVFFTPVAAGFESNAMVAGEASFQRTGPNSRLLVGFETGGSFASGFPFGSANRAYLDVGHTGALGPFSRVFHVLLGTGAGSLTAQNAFRLGAASFEERWGSDAYRNIGAVFEQPWDDGHWVAFSGPGPVAYTVRETGGGSALSLGAPFGQHIAAASARLIASLPSSSALVRPLRIELFVGAGDVWRGDSFISDFDASDLLYDAGFGLQYDPSDLGLLQRWRAQSDVLSNLRLAARFPVWASDPELIGDDSPLAFRWLLGVIVDDPLWD